MFARIDPGNMTYTPIYRLKKAGGGAAVEEAVARTLPMYRIAAAHNKGPSIADIMDGEISDARKCRACAKVEDPSQGAGKLLVCQRCRTAYYCSKECQRADWKEHKAACAQHIEFPAFSKDGKHRQDVRSTTQSESESRDADDGGGDSGDVSNYERWLTMIECGAAQGSQDALGAKADILLSLNDYAAAAAILLPLAEAGHARSQCKVRCAELICLFGGKMID